MSIRSGSLLRVALAAWALAAWAGAARAAPDAQPAPAPANGEQARPRDAAEAVQEGDVNQWLQHYQRERGEEWAKQRGAAPARETAEPPPDQ